jgi:hypothetical protein
LLCPSAQSPHSKPIVTTTIRGAARKRRCRLAPETRGRCPCHTTTPLRHPADHATTVDTRSTTGARKVGLDTVSCNVARGCCLRGSRGGPRAASLADLSVHSKSLGANAIPGTGQERRTRECMDMRVATMAAILIALVSASAYAFGGGYNAAAAYEACQVDAAQGQHYAINGDCPNWEAWKARHLQGQTSPHRRAYPTSRSRYHLSQ